MEHKPAGLTPEQVVTVPTAQEHPQYLGLEEWFFVEHTVEMGIMNISGWHLCPFRDEVTLPVYQVLQLSTLMP